MNGVELENSFIFSFKIQNNFIKDAILSNIRDIDRAATYHMYHGPSFGFDLRMSNGTLDEFNELENFNYNHCVKRYYEKRIRDTEDNFSIDGYEVFQIIRK